MSELGSSSLPDSPGEKSENSSMGTVVLANYIVPTLQKLPTFSLSTYLKYVEPLGYEVEIRTKIYHLVPMIQSAHESANGNSGLARNHGNLFGIKATKAWEDAGHPVANMPTWEEIGGKKVEMKQEFKQYASWRDSFLNWAELISTANMYRRAYELLKDKTTVPEGIEAMALIYATDHAYARKLRGIYDQILKEQV